MAWWVLIHTVPKSYSIITDLSVIFCAANLCLWLRTSLSWKWMEGVRCCLGVQKTGVPKGWDRLTWQWLFKKICALFLCFKGYTQWKLEDNEGKRPLRSLWHLPVNFSGTCQHTRRRTEEGGCLPCKRKDTRESGAQILYPLVMEHLCWNCVALYITGAVVDPPREPGDGDALQSAHGWGQWEAEQRGWEVPPGNHGC